MLDSVISNNINFIDSTNLLFTLITIILVLSIYLIFENNLFSNVVTLSLVSLLLSCCYLLMDGPDVAMTETALGAAFSTLIMLNAIKLFPNKIAATSKKYLIAALLIVGALIVAILRLGWNITEYGLSNTAFHQNINQYYLNNTYKDIGIPSFVAAILASYRGFDTLGETTVILIAGIAVAFIMSKKRV
jgi:multicomponent Na+:H+ antiporter subunit B